MTRLWAVTATFDSVSVGDQLPILVKWGSGEAACGINIPLRSGQKPEGSTPSTTEPPSIPDLHAYFLELLGKGFPFTSIEAEGSSLTVETLHPVTTEDTISLTGKVVDKRTDGDRKVVACRMVVENQDGQTVAEAVAEISMP